MAPIRILQVVTKMDRGGLETMLMNYYRHIDREKVQFDFLVHREERGAYDDEIEALGGKIFRLPRLNPFSRSYRAKLKRFFFEHEEYRCVHVHQDCMSSVILKAAKKAKIPVRIAHSHSSSQDKNSKYVIKLLYRHSICRYATTLFACGKDAGQWMFCGAPYQIVHNAINLERYTFQEEIRQKMRNELHLKDSIVVGHVGRFSPPKNHLFLLRIFSEFLRLEPNAVLLLVGGGDGMAAAEKQAAELDIASQVRFLGVRSDIPELLQAMDVFVFPSLYEGVPIAMVEAQASGLPCVISDRLPPECILAEALVKVVPLTENAECWASKAIESSKIGHTDHYAEVAAHGFDITTEAIKLQTFYVEALK